MKFKVREMLTSAISENIFPLKYLVSISVIPQQRKRWEEFTLLFASLENDQRHLT